jgi:hypothetical protein
MDLVMEMAYELEAQGLYGASEQALCAEDIASVLEALQMREVSFHSFWDFDPQKEFAVDDDQDDSEM